MSLRNIRLAAPAILLLLLSGAVCAEDRQDPVHFPTSCDPMVQAEFDAGVTQLHTFAFDAAGRTFQSVLQKDPKCAMAWWGVALDLLGDPLAAPPAAKDVLAAVAAIEKARAADAKTPRERAWIDAVGAYFREPDQEPSATRMDAYDAAMEQLVQKYPDDFEARAFRALAMIASAARNDVRYTSQEKAAAALEKLFAQNPRHPGVTHYLILAYDAPPLAARGLPAARRYAAMAPASANARHAPSHIYTRLGLWDDVIAANEYALVLQPDYFPALDVSVHAALQLAQDDKAKVLVERAAKTAIPADRPLSAEGAAALAAIPARYTLERMDWAAAAALPATPSGFAQADAITRFARGLGMALTGNVAGARREIEAMNALRAALQKSDLGYWADRTEEQMLTISAWVALAEGDRPEAIKRMLAAANSEDAHIGNPLLSNRLYPARELLAQMLVEVGSPAAALQEFETALAANPGRYRALWGAVLTAAAMNQRQKAFDYIDRFVALTKNAGAQRPEVAKARAFVAKR